MTDQAVVRSCNPVVKKGGVVDVTSNKPGLKLSDARINPYTISFNRVPRTVTPLDHHTMPEECREAIREYQEEVLELQSEVNTLNQQVELQRKLTYLYQENVALLQLFSQKQLMILYDVLVMSTILSQLNPRHQDLERLIRWANNPDIVEHTLDSTHAWVDSGRGDLQSAMPSIRQVLAIFGRITDNMKRRCKRWLELRYELSHPE